MSDYSNYVSDTSAIPNFADAMMRAITPFHDKSLRVPFYITNSYRQRYGKKGLSMLMNPTNVAFSQTKRITKKDTQEGSTFLHWTNHLGRNNDILTMNFQGMTGNINIRTGGQFKTGFGDKAAGAANEFSDWLDSKLSENSGATESGLLAVQPANLTKNAAGAARVAAFWNLYSLTREPVLDPTYGIPNYSYISYSSPLFGNSFVTFIGHFNQVLEFSDVADEPFNKRWSFGFTAIDSQPKQDDLFAAVLNNLSQAMLNSMG
jgi:hypothetical protein